MHGLERDCLEALAAVAKDLGLFPNTHLVVRSCGIQYLFPWAPDTHVALIYTCKQNSIHILKNKPYYK